MPDGQRSRRGSAEDHRVGQLGVGVLERISERSIEPPLLRLRKSISDKGISTVVEGKLGITSELPSTCVQLATTRLPLPIVAVQEVNFRRTHPSTIVKQKEQQTILMPIGSSQ